MAISVKVIAKWQELKFKKIIAFMEKAIAQSSEVLQRSVTIQQMAHDTEYLVACEISSYLKN